MIGYGYIANSQQSASTIMGMRVLMGLIPTVMTVLAFIIYAKFYKLEGSFLEDVMKKLHSKNGTEKPKKA